MQIHELNNKKRPNTEQVQEAIPGWNLAKEIVKNPAALVSNTAMAQAKQAAAQQTAAGLSQKLTKQGYTTAAAPKKATDLLPQIKANAATQQMIKTLGAEWQRIATQLTKQPVKEYTVAPTQQASTAGAQYAQRPGGYGQTTINAPTTDTPQATSTGAALKNLQAQQAQQTQAAMMDEFTKWANTKLTALKVDLDDVNKDPAVASALKNLANKIAADPAGTSKEVNEYFNLAIAANIADNQARRAGFYQPTPGAAAPAAQVPQKPQDITAQAGLNPQILQGLGAVLRRADQGSMTMPRTNNPVADAMFQQMGFKLK